MHDDVDSHQLVLPIFDVFVFVDWFGTLSTSRFWEDITDNSRHPLSPQLRSSLEHLFAEERELVQDWMRGKVSDSDVVETMQITLPSNYGQDYLLRALLRTCRRASVHPPMANLLRALKRQSFVAIASDNMDCFIHATPTILRNDLRIDELIVSSQIGSLKSEDPESFFGPVLEQYSIARSHAVLIDDSYETCVRFSEWGGHAFYFSGVDRLRSEIDTRWPGGKAFATNLVRAMT